MGRHGGRKRQERLQHAHVARRGGHADLRVVAQPQTELQHVPRILPALPLRQLVHPRAVELRPAQGLRLACRVDHRLRAVGPDEALARRLPERTAVGRRTGEDAAVAEDHDLARLVEGLADDRHALAAARLQRTRTFDLRAHPFGPGARLARAAAAEDHPCPPVPLGRELVRMGPEIEKVGERDAPPFRQCIPELNLNLGRRGGDPGGT